MTREAVVATVDGKPLRAAFPMRVELFGVDAVVIPAAEYEELRATASQAVAPRRRERKPRSPIDNDPEVAEFLAERRTLLFIPEALAECEQRFGPERTPSRSALCRFWQALEGRSASKAAPAG